MASQSLERRRRRFWRPADWSIEAKVLVGVVSMVVIALICAGLLNSARAVAGFSASIGLHFEELAGSQINYLADMLAEQLSVVRGIALVDGIQRAVEQENNLYTAGPDVIKMDLETMEAQWQERDDDASLVQKVIDPERNATTAQLLQYQQSFPDHVEILVTDKFGALVAATDRPAHYYYADADWWLKTYKDGKGALYLDSAVPESGGAYTDLKIAVPIYSAGRAVVGVVQSTFRLDSVALAVTQLQVGRTGGAALARQGGVILAEKDLNRVGTMLPQTWYGATYQAAKQGSAQLLDYTGEPVVVGYATIDTAMIEHAEERRVIHGLDWVLYVYQPQVEAHELIENVRQTSIIVTVLFGLFAAAVSLFLSRVIVSPISRLLAVARQFAAGDMRARALVNRGDETGEMAEVFNLLADKVVESLGMLEQRVAARTRGLLTAAQVSQATTGVADPLFLMQQVVEMTRDHLGLYYVGLFLLDDLRRFAVLRAGTGEAGRRMLADGHRLEVGGTSMIGQCTAQNRPVTTVDVRQERIHFKNPHLPDTRSELALPLRARGEVIGAMTVQSTQPGAFDDEDVAVLQTIADQVAGAIRGAELFAETQEALRQTRAALAEAQAAERRLLREAWEEYPKTAEATMSCYVGDFDAPAQTEIRQAIASRQRLAMPGDGGHAALVAPITVAGMPVGALGVHADRSRHWTEDEVLLFEAVAERLALAVENRRLDEQTQRALAENEALYVGSGQVVRATTVDEVLHALVVSTALQRLDSASILLFNRPWVETRPETVSLAALWQRSGGPAIPIGADLDLAQFPMVDLFAPDKPFVVEDIAADERVDAQVREYLHRQMGLRSVALFPIVVNEQWVGLVSGQSAEAVALSEMEVRRIVSLTDQAGTVIENRRLLQQTEVALQETSALYSASGLINRATTPDEVLHAMLEGIGLPGLAHAMIWLYDRAWSDNAMPQYQEVVAAWGVRAGQPAVEVGMRMRLEDFPVMAHLGRDVPLLVGDLENPPRYLAPEGVLFLRETLQARGVAFVPLVAGEQWIGNFNLNTSQPVEFGDTLLRRLTALAGQAAVAIEAIRRLKQTQESLKETESLYQASAQINTATTLDEVLGAMLAGVEFPFASRAMIALFNRPWLGHDMPEYFDSAAAWDERDDDPVVQAGMRFSMDQSIIGLLLKPDEPLVIGDVDADHRLDAATRTQYKTFFQAKSALFVPLVAAGQWIGTFNLMMSRAVAFDETYRRRVMTMAGQAAVAIQAINRLQQTQTALAETRTLYDGSARINAAGTASEILDALRQSTFLGQADGTAITLFDRPWAGGDMPDSGYVMASWHVDESGGLLRTGQTVPMSVFPSVHVLRPDEPLVMRDVATDARLDEASRAVTLQANIRSSVIAPLVAGGQWIGLVTAGMREATDIPEAGVRRLMALAGQAAVALQSQLRFQATQNALREAQALYQFTEVVSGVTDLQLVYGAITRALVEELGYADSWIAVLDEDAQTLQGVAGAGVNATDATIFTTTPLSDTRNPAVIAVKERRTVTLNDAGTNTDITGLLPSLKALMGKIIEAPVFVSSRVAGVIAATRPPHAPDITERDAQLFQAVVTQASVAIQRAQLFEQTQATLAETRALYEGAELINRAGTFRQVLEALRQSTVVGERESVAIQLFNHPWVSDDAPEWFQPAAYWHEGQFLDVPERFAMGMLPNVARLREEEIFISNDAAGDARIGPAYRQLLTFNCALIVKLVIGAEWVGFVEVNSPRPFAPAEHEARQLLTMTAQAAVALRSQQLYRQTQANLALNQSLYNAGRRINEAADLPAIVAAALEEVPVAGINRAVLALFEPGGGSEPGTMIVAANWYSGAGTPPAPPGTQYSSQTFPLFHRLLSPDPLFFADIRHDARIDTGSRAVFAGQNICAAAVLPLWVGVRQLGILMLQSEEEHEFTDEEMQPYLSLARQMATRIDNQNLFEQTQATLAETRALYDGSARINAARSFDGILDAIRHSTLIGQMDMAGLALFNRPSIDDRVPEQIIPVAMWGTDEVAQSRMLNRPMDLSDYSFVQAASRDEPLYACDVASDPRMDAKTRAAYERIGARSVIFIPLVAGGQWIGYINAFNDQPTEYDEMDLRRLMTIGSQAAIAVQSLLSQQQTEEVLQETSVLYKASQALVTASSTQGLLDAVAGYGLEAGAQAVMLVYLELGEAGRPEWGHVMAQSDTGEREMSNMVGARFALADYPFADIWLEDSDNPMLVGDVTRNTQMTGAALESLRRQNVRATVVLPLRSGGRWIGVVIYNWAEPQNFTERDERIYRTLRDQAAVAIDGRRLQQETEARALRERTLRQITSRVRGATDPDAIVRAAVRELGAALGRPTFVRLGSAAELACSQPANGDGKHGAEAGVDQQTEQGGE